MSDEKSTLFDEDNLEQASEYLRLALTKLSQHKTPATPVNYSLLYNYVAGKDLNIKEKIDETWDDNGELNSDFAESLFIKSFYCDDKMNEALRGDLLSMVAQVIGALIDIADKSKQSNMNLMKHITSLAKTSEATEVVKVVTEIVKDTRAFVAETERFESNIDESTDHINKLKKELDHARREATIDTLTKLYNRRSFNTKIEELVNDKSKKTCGFCLIFIDIDFFKKVNDDHGHLVGDKVLSGLAQILKSKVRGSDFTARYGGEEFVVLLPDTEIRNAFCVAENIRKSIERNKLTLRKSKQSIGSITASFGVAGYKIGESADGLISRCDKALYKAKKLGRNRTVIAE